MHINNSSRPAVHDELDDSDAEMPSRPSKRVLVVELSDSDDEDDDFMPVDIRNGNPAPGLRNVVRRSNLLESR